MHANQCIATNLIAAEIVERFVKCENGFLRVLCHIDADLRLFYADRLVAAGRHNVNFLSETLKNPCNVSSNWHSNATLRFLLAERSLTDTHADLGGH